jgi:hypothetical protein
LAVGIDNDRRRARQGDRDMRQRCSLAFALLFVALVATAGAQTHAPTFNRGYVCTYPQGPWTNEINSGASIFLDQQGIYGTEVYQASTHTGIDNRRIAFAKPQDFCGPRDPHCLDPESEVVRTRWEFTIANGIQCTNTVVRNLGRDIVFAGCSNGKTRVCRY